LFDTLLASQLVSARDIEERHGLTAITERYLETVDKSERLSNWEFELSEGDDYAHFKNASTKFAKILARARPRRYPCAEI
jgi:hypothetical protein